MTAVGRLFRRYGVLLGCLALISMAGTWFAGLEKTHSVVCRWVPVWKSFSPFDCSDPQAASIEPYGISYRRRLAHFRVAISDGDEQFLRHLGDAKFRIDSKDLCEVTGWLSERKGTVKLSDQAISIFLDSINLNSTCPNSWILRGPASLAVLMLDYGLLPLDAEKGMDGFHGSCGAGLAATYWPRQVQLIELLLSKTGRPADFNEAVTAYSGLIKRLQDEPPTTFVRACAAHILAEAEQPTSAPEFIFSSACVHRRLTRYWEEVGASVKVFEDRRADETVDEAEHRHLQAAAMKICSEVRGLDMTAYSKQLHIWSTP